MADMYTSEWFEERYKDTPTDVIERQLKYFTFDYYGCYDEYEWLTKEIDRRKGLT